MKGWKVMTPKAARRQKRRLDNNAAAKDARFWVGKIRTAERIGFRGSAILTPINRQTQQQRPHKRQRTKGETARANLTSLYVVRFMQLGGGAVFLKIGITKNEIVERFAADVRQYQIDLICKIGGLRRDEAATIEAKLHQFFAAVKFNPNPPLLSGGNSECFNYSSSLEEGMKFLLNSWLGSVGRALVS